MILSGIQKLSLLDYPGMISHVVFTGGCNLRCPYCHNWDIARHPVERMLGRDFFALLKKDFHLLDGVCVSGGEPCIHADLPKFLEKIHNLGLRVKLDTNGFYPEMLCRLLHEDLVDYIALDIKNCPDRYGVTTGCPEISLEPLYESIRIITTSAIPYEFRTTVVDPLHDLASFEKISDLLSSITASSGKKIARYYLQPFEPRESVPDKTLRKPDMPMLQACAGPLLRSCELVGIR